MDPLAVDAVGRVPHGSSDDPSVLDFSANTNPVTPDGLEAVYEDAFEAARSYPPEPPAEYVEAAADYVDCDPDDVISTPGGLAAIRLAIEIVVQSGDSVLVPAPSFGEYEREVRLQGATPAFVDHDRILDVDPADHAMAIVCQPNNPTGNAYDVDALERFAGDCREADTVLLVDEAFLDFTTRPSVAGTAGVVVARSLTKMFGLPGIRAGFAVAPGRIGAALETARRPWNVGTPALRVGTHCLHRRDFVADTRRRVRNERRRMRTRLSERFDVHPSDAPFLLVDVGDRSVESVVEKARDRGIAIRDATTFRNLDSHVRVAVRLPRENDRLLSVLDDV
ncbi:MAG: aminotransferase class I/II-fold pyridoxal phosphate-dependent enzyme [Natronomonas sp.]